MPTFDSLKAEYAQCLGRMRVVPARENSIESTAARLDKNLSLYKEVSDATEVPIPVLMAIHERESSGDFKTYLGNGEPLSRVTRLVPKGRGPFTGADAWAKGAIDALKIDHLDKVGKANWVWERACYQTELYNGFGPRNHGRHSGYVWSGTNIYEGGKYVADGVWNPNAQDAQNGTIPVMKQIVHIAPELDLGANMPQVIQQAASISHMQEQQGKAIVLPIPTPVPWATNDNVKRLQQALNGSKIDPYEMVLPLPVNGLYDRATRLAVQMLQVENSQEPTGEPDQFVQEKLGITLSA